MRLGEYLKRTGEKQAAFATRAGISQQTVSELCNGKGARSKTAAKVIQATGGLVAIEDLLPEEADQSGAAVA
jgi:transcriptional regulator with XRE-family HTH domain